SGCGESVASGSLGLAQHVRYGDLGNGCHVEGVWKRACCSPVAIIAVRDPIAADGPMVSCAVASVGVVTVTGPNPPAGPPPTEMSGPKLICAAPWRKF